MCYKVVIGFCCTDNKMNLEENEIEELFKKVHEMYSNEKYDEAIPLLAQILEIWPQGEDVHNYIAQCYQKGDKKKNYILAEKHYLEALKITNEKNSAIIANYLSFLMHDTFELHKGSKYDLEYLLNMDQNISG